MSPVQAATAEIDLHEQAPDKAKAALARSATIAELWSLFDVAAAHMAADDCGKAQVEQTQSATERRYALREADGSTRYIALLPLLPTTRGTASCGAFLATSDTRQAIYLEPAADHAWAVVTSGEMLDAATVQSLFERVFTA